MIGRVYKGHVNALQLTQTFVNGKLPDGTWQMGIVPMDQAQTECDRSWWQPMGMRATNCYKIDFSSVELGDEALIGQPGDYLRQPWLTTGVVRFAAVQLGGAAALFDLTRQYLQGEQRAKAFEKISLNDIKSWFTNYCYGTSPGRETL